MSRISSCQRAWVSAISRSDSNSAAMKTKDTQPRLQAAQAQMEALQAGASGLPELMQQAHRDANADEYFRLIAREHAIPSDLSELDTEVLTFRRQSMLERYDALAAAEPQLRVKYEEAVRRNQERIRLIEAESSAASSASHVNVQEGRALDQELQAMAVTGREVY